MRDRARRKERGDEVTDTEDEDDEMEEEMEEGTRSRPHSRSASVARSARSTSSAPSTPPATSAAEILAELGMSLPVEDAVLEAMSSKKVTIFEQSCYTLFGEYVCRMAAELGMQYGRRSDFVLERANLLLKEKRGPNRANKFRTYISRTRQDEMQGMTKEEKVKFMDKCYAEYMQGTTTGEEREERMQEVYEYLQDDVVGGGSSIVAPEVRFERWRAMIERLLNIIRRTDPEFDVAGIMVYSGDNPSAHQKDGLFVNSSFLKDLFEREEYPIRKWTDIFATTVRAARYQQDLRQVLDIDGNHEGSKDVPVSVNTSRKTSGMSSSSERYAPSKDSQKDFKQIFMAKWHETVPRPKSKRTTMLLTTFANYAETEKVALTGWPSHKVDTPLGPNFVSGKLSHKQWALLANLLDSGKMKISPWDQKFLQISEDNAQYGEIPLVSSSNGKAMVFVKDSQQWINQFCKIQADGKRVAGKRHHAEVEAEVEGDEGTQNLQGPSSCPSSPPLKKRKVSFVTLPKASFYDNHRGAPKSYKVNPRFLNSTSTPSTSKPTPQVTKETEAFFCAVKGSSASSSLKRS
ncbi:uncharacterized protein LACBIDRAFT_316216 [Laccaria bicolor S238N-H82]|uniref:Predicted protein n=1 Tax=Laccaria bicolor (strain S238N-H82 / ATCC MYA-4686) TaxID=486041 RepID=B0E0G2_LACBS|nr:uncharacterized protein LACBIDRAFT_316216 [Laccaria bicolor S238N-H82]EDQ99681.1 predicted protein [Laccaria bicolor S238N-H82]|eukprot:XP_001889658.1 predicted protein [Laccaria bicolor S238N-H82]